MRELWLDHVPGSILLRRWCDHCGGPVWRWRECPRHTHYYRPTYLKIVGMGWGHGKSVYRRQCGRQQLRKS